MISIASPINKYTILFFRRKLIMSSHRRSTDVEPPINIMDYHTVVENNYNDSIKKIREVLLFFSEYKRNITIIAADSDKCVEPLYKPIVYADTFPKILKSKLEEIMDSILILTNSCVKLHHDTSKVVLDIVGKNQMIHQVPEILKLVYTPHSIAHSKVIPKLIADINDLLLVDSLKIMSLDGCYLKNSARNSLVHEVHMMYETTLQNLLQMMITDATVSYMNIYIASIAIKDFNCEKYSNGEVLRSGSHHHFYN